MTAAMFAHLAHDAHPKRGYSEGAAYARALQQTRSHRLRDGARYEAYPCRCGRWHTRRAAR